MEVIMQNNDLDPAFVTGLGSGYIQGVFESSKAEGSICPSIGVTNGRAYEVVLKYLENHPIGAVFDYSLSTIQRALAEEFPCE